MIRNIFLAFSFITWFSCSNQESKDSNHTHTEAKTEATKKNPYKEIKFDNEKDFACGMPVSAGVNDTAHYKGKVYGFCATECKNEFLKNPEGYLAGNK
jgi:YHS domain-containing protein